VSNRLPYGVEPVHSPGNHAVYAIVDNSKGGTPEILVTGARLAVARLIVDALNEKEKLRSFMHYDHQQA
jgi:hypothetical protein